MTNIRLLFSIFSPICIIIIYLGWLKIIELKHLLPKNNEVCEFGNSQVIVFLSYPFFSGMIIGVNFIALFVFIQFLDRYWTLFVYLPVIFLSFYCYRDLEQKKVLFVKNIVEHPTTYYKANFPNVKFNGVVKGKLVDIQNRLMVELVENNEKKFIFWDKIDVIEFSPPNDRNNNSINEK